MHVCPVQYSGAQSEAETKVCPSDPHTADTSFSPPGIHCLLRPAFLQQASKLCYRLSGLSILLSVDVVLGFGYDGTACICCQGGHGGLRGVRACVRLALQDAGPV